MNELISTVGAIFAILCFSLAAILLIAVVASFIRFMIKETWN